MSPLFNEWSSSSSSSLWDSITGENTCFLSIRKIIKIKKKKHLKNYHRKLKIVNSWDDDISDVFRSDTKCEGERGMIFPDKMFLRRRNYENENLVKWYSEESQRIITPAQPVSKHRIKWKIVEKTNLISKEWWNPFLLWEKRNGEGRERTSVRECRELLLLRADDAR